jgi:transposase-like protein
MQMYRQIHERVADGEPLYAACKDVGVWPHQYYHWRKRHAKDDSRPVRKKRRQQRHAENYEAVPVPESTGEFQLKTTPEQLARFIRAMHDQFRGAQ